MKSFPWFTIVLVAAAAVAWTLRGHGAGLGWQPGAVPWRLVTSQLSHWDPNHLLWDALAVLLLGGWAESRWPGPTRLSLTIAIVLVPAVVVAVHPDMAFRGLSGLACTLAMIGALHTWSEAWRPRDPTALLLSASLVLGLLTKTAYELITADALFAQAATWQPVPVAHLAGMAAAGLGFAATHLLARPTSLPGVRHA